MPPRLYDLETSLLRLKNAFAQRKFHKSYLDLRERQRLIVDASVAELLTSLVSIEAEIHGAKRQVGFGAGIKKS